MKGNERGEEATEMEARCQHCWREFRTLYWKLGMFTPCPYCHSNTFLGSACMLDLGASDWSVTFLDFIQLVGDTGSDVNILPLLSTFGYERLLEQPLQFRDVSGRTLTAEEVHTQIQTDTKRQYDLYQAVMTLWR